jgi:exonuclease-1
MGIENLLPTIKEHCKQSHLSNYAGQRMGVDAYCWLHRAAFADNMDLAFNPDSLSYIYFIKGMVQRMLKLGVVPVFVFDGNKLPIKNAEDSERAFRREEKRKAAQALLEAGRTEEARLKMITSLDITPEMAQRLVIELQAMEIECVVAPYEADAQLAYLDKIGYIDVVCTEDSDLIAYGCSKVIYKLDSKGNCMEVRYVDIMTSPKFKYFSYTMFLEFCVLSGCDFFKLSGISCKRAYKLISKFKSFEAATAEIERIVKFKLPEPSPLQFARAVQTFRHQVVYCPLTQTHVHLSPLNMKQHEDFLGTMLKPELAHAVAMGLLHPVTLQPFV